MIVANWIEFILLYPIICIACLMKSRSIIINYFKQYHPVVRAREPCRITSIFGFSFLSFHVLITCLLSILDDLHHVGSRSSHDLHFSEPSEAALVLFPLAIFIENSHRFYFILKI